MGSKALQTYEEARSATTTGGARKGVLDSFAAATDNWTRSALVAAATEQAPDVRGGGADATPARRC